MKARLVLVAIAIVVVAVVAVRCRSGADPVPSPSVASTTAAAFVPPASYGPAVPKAQAQELLAQLVVEAPITEPAYDREAFGGWADDDGDCRDTRAEVLAEEAVVAVTGECSIESGRWVSPYEGSDLGAPDEVDIDHTVALANAWGAGASSWTPEQREAYMNDLEHPEHLVAVSSSINRSKGARSPDEWMIPSANQATRCAYLTNWVVIKARWNLTVTAAEYDTLRRGLGSQC